MKAIYACLHADIAYLRTGLAADKPTFSKIQAIREAVGTISDIADIENIL